jgi:hypothetical protein
MESAMTSLRWLGVLPFLGILGGIFLANRVTPWLLGMPFILGWLVLCVIGTAAVMGVIYLTDPANRDTARHEQ